MSNHTEPAPIPFIPKPVSPNPSLLPSYPEDIDQYIELDLQERQNELLRKEEEMEKRSRYIEKREIEFRKTADEIEKREMVQDGRDEEFLKKTEMLLEQEDGIRRSRMLLRAYSTFVVVGCCYLV
ncbi:hypothetical protein F2P56_011371, partial [Juglans regia]